MALLLAVDDDPDICALVRATFTDAGHGVLVTSVADEGIALALRHHPDALVLDIWMPGKLDGLGIARMLKARPETADIPIVFISALVIGGEAAARAAGGAAFVAKPFELDELLGAVAAVLPRKEALP